jgi:hypothetical protein
MLRFKEWLWHEEKMRSLDKKKGQKHDKEPENYLDGMWRELGIDPNSVPEYIESGPIELPEEGLWFNQAIWKVEKPIDLKDSFVRITFHKSLSPNLNQRCYVRREDGEMEPAEEDIDGKTYLIPIDKFAEMLSKPWQSAAGGMGGGGPGGPPI